MLPSPIVLILNSGNTDCDQIIQQLKLPKRESKIPTPRKDKSPLMCSVIKWPLCVGGFGRSGRQAFGCIDRLATHVTGGQPSCIFVSSKGVGKERLTQTASVTTCAISRRVAKYKLALQDRQGAVHQGQGQVHQTRDVGRHKHVLWQLVEELARQWHRVGSMYVV